MRNLLPLIILAALPVATIASKNVNFPVNHVTVAVNGSYEVLLGPGLLRQYWPYTITCQLTNPSKQNVNVVGRIDGYFGDAMGLNSDLSYKLNGQDTVALLHLKPGANTFVASHVHHNNSSLMSFNYTNYDNDSAFIIESCSGTME